MSVDWTLPRVQGFLGVSRGPALRRFRQETNWTKGGKVSRLITPRQSCMKLRNIDGNINFVNRACCELLGSDAAEIKDANFFSVFGQPDRRGQSIEDYLKRFDKDANPSGSMSVSIENAKGGKTLRANCVTMQWDHQRLLVTQLN